MPILKVSPELDRIVSPDQDIEDLGRDSGFVETSQPEGPLWFKEDGHLLFSDITGNKRLKWAPREGITLNRESTNNANGLTRDREGRLVACEHTTRRVTRLQADGSITVVADQYQGKKLNAPNDVVVKSDGSIYFTDPDSLCPAPELGFVGVYRVSPDLSILTLVCGTDFATPNGLAFSPDESILYVSDSRGGVEIRAYDVQNDGSLANERVFFKFESDLRGVPDGMKLDVEGNIYCTGPGGVWIIDPSGKHLGTILTGARQTTNCGWGGEDWRSLYITAFDPWLAQIRLKIPGLPVPVNPA